MSAVDADEPSAGHKFFFSLAPEGTYRSNFTVRDNGGRKNKLNIDLRKIRVSFRILCELQRPFHLVRFYFTSLIMLWFHPKSQD